MKLALVILMLSASPLLCACGSDGEADDDGDSDKGTDAGQQQETPRMRSDGEDGVVRCDIDDPCCVVNVDFDIRVCAGERLDGGMTSMDAAVEDEDDAG